MMTLRPIGAVLCLAVVAAGLAGSGTTAAAVAVPAPVDMNTSGSFVDTFAGPPAVAPLYGLNQGLDSRQTGTARSAYTRVSGLWQVGAPPPPASAVQVNNAAYPDRLSFWSTISAVMLDAPVLADASGHYTVSTTVDPVVGDVTTGDWASVVFSRSRMSAGYVTNADVDLGLTVSANGSLALYHAGTLFWSATVPAANGYALSVTVSTGADKTVALVVNGSVLTAVAPAAVNRWPSTPYLYLGAYLSTASRVTTFGSGQPGSGLSVSTVDTYVPSAATPFVDTFDGAADTDPTGYGLNQDLRARQPAAVSSGYTRISGRWDAVPPSVWQSQVNHPAYPDRLSFWVGPSAVRLAKPVLAGLDGRYSVRVVVDPVASGDDRSSQDWGSLMLSGSATSTGYPTGTEVDLGVTVRSNGRVQVYLHGAPYFATEPVVAPAADGSYPIGVTVASDATREATLTVGDATWTVHTGQDLPRLSYLMLGAYLSTGTEVTTFDDLRVSLLGGLTHYGLFDVLDPTDHVDHSADVAGFTNLNVYLDISSWAFLDYCRPRSCVVLLQWVLFTMDSTGTVMVLRPDAVQSLAATVADIGGNLGKVGGAYLVDEPYGAWGGRNVSAADLQAAALDARQAFPDQPLLTTLDAASVKVPVSARKAIPAQIDWVGFDQYCAPLSGLRSTLDTLQSRLSVYQRMYLVPESAAGRSWCPGTTDASIAAKQSDYQRLAAGNPRVTYLMNFGWWLGNYTDGNQYLGEHQPFTNLPRTVAVQQALGRSILGLG